MTEVDTSALEARNLALTREPSHTPSQFPYQIVAFLDKEPSVGEPVYYGENGWYPQVALKRRFALKSINEDTLIELVRDFFQPRGEIIFETGDPLKPDRMPVRVIDIKNQTDLRTLHLQLIQELDDTITSRFPERDGENYYAHITAEHEGKLVIPVDDYTNKTFHTSNIWLLKDADGPNSQAYIKII